MNDEGNSTTRSPATRTRRSLKRVQMRGGAPRPHAQRTESTPRVRPWGAASHLDPFERPAGSGGRRARGRVSFVVHPPRRGAAMKIVGVDTFTLRVPTVKPIALDLPEHRLVVARIHSDSGPEGLGYTLVFGGA